MLKLARGLAAGVILFCGATFGGALAQMGIPYGGVNLAQAAVAWFNLIGSLSGPQTPFSCIGGNSCWDANQINITGDSTASGLNTIENGLGIHHTIGGAAYTGLGTGIFSAVQISAATGNTQGQYSSSTNYATATTNDNGSSGSPAGSLWASNPNAFLGNGATFWLQLVGQEVDVTAGSGSSMSDKIGQMVVQGAGDSVVGSRSNLGYALTNQAGAQGWDCGYCIGNFSGNWSLTATSTLMGCWPHGVARNSSGAAVPTSVGCGTTLYGVDLSNITIASGGAPYLAPLITPASSSATCKQGSIEWDANFIYICTASNTFKRAALATF